MDLGSVTILEAKINEGTVLEFRVGDIVSVQKKDGTFLEGRIIYIDTEFFEMDCSSKYKSNILDVKFKEIDAISKQAVPQEDK